AADSREAADSGLAVRGGAISPTGIAGYSVGGGLGWLMAKYGLAADNLPSVEIVTADGQILNASETSHPDLFWAVRGGGGNFGIVTTVEIQLHHQPMGVGGLSAHPTDPGHDLLRFYPPPCSSASCVLNLFAGLVHAPHASGIAL